MITRCVEERGMEDVGWRRKIATGSNIKYTKKLQIT